MVYFRKGDLLESECDYICHQVNCMGKMNSGIAKQIREKWPIVFQNYMAKCNFSHPSGYVRPEVLLGDIQFVPLYEDYYKDVKRQQVINMFGQYGYGYDGFEAKFDTAIAAYILNATGNSYEYDDIANTFLNETYPSAEEVLGKGRTKKAAEQNAAYQSLLTFEQGDNALEQRG